MEPSNPEPPSYQDVVESAPRTLLPDGELPLLILDKETIYPAAEPWRAMYRLTGAPTNAGSSTYGVERIRYQLSDTAGDGDIRSRTTHLYNISNFSPLDHSIVRVQGKAGPKRAYQTVELSGLLGWTVCRAKGHFKAAPKGRQTVEWRSAETGEVVAVETRLKRETGDEEDRKKLVRLPQLEVKAILPDKDLDLLVSCWVARVWKESVKDFREPFSWQKFKRIMTSGTEKQPGIYGGFRMAGVI